MITNFKQSNTRSAAAEEIPARNGPNEGLQQPVGEIPMRNKIVFYEHKTLKLGKPHNDALIVKLEIGGACLSKILVDTGSSSNIL